MPPPEPAPSKPPARRMFFVLALALLFLFLGANAWLTGWAGGEADPEEAARAELRSKALAEVRADSAARLSRYAWVNRANGSVQIPIEQAIERVLPELNSSRPHAAYPIAQPAAAATPVPAQPARPAP
ncbi:MAG: hypothetical protein WCS65_04105 [Verrucomicrobiae bacterium]